MDQYLWLYRKAMFLDSLHILFGYESSTFWLASEKMSGLRILVLRSKSCCSLSIELLEDYCVSTNWNTSSRAGILYSENI